MTADDSTRNIAIQLMELAAQDHVESHDRRAYYARAARQQGVSIKDIADAYQVSELEAVELSSDGDVRPIRDAYQLGYRDGYQGAHDQYQEHEKRIYQGAYVAGLNAGSASAMEILGVRHSA